MKCSLIKIRLRGSTRRPTGFILLVTVIVLVVLASLTTGLAVRMSMAHRRQQYMIEYQRARYGLDSAMKYILNVLPDKNFTLVDRNEMPDFSDIFLKDSGEYAKFIASWAETATIEQIESVLKEGASLTQPQSLNDEESVSELLSLFGIGDSVDANDLNVDPNDSDNVDQDYDVIELDPNDVVVPGPYGAPWPYVAEPMDLEIGPCNITITIEDENAKMPLTWLVTDSKKTDKNAEYALKTFCEWTSWDRQQCDELEAAIIDATDKIFEKKVFKLNPDPIILKTTAPQTNTKSVRPSSRTRSRRRKTPKTVATEKRPVIANTTDFAKLFHSSLLDQEFLARPLPNTGDRIESPLKYLSLWGAQRVNINTAPRNVLEAAFMLAEIDSFDLPKLTQSVIEARQKKVFKKIDDLKDLGFDSDEIKNLQNYLTTTSTFFKIRVTSRSGNARSSAVATVVKEGKKTERLMVLYEQ